MAFAKKEVRLPGGPLTYYTAGQGQPVLYLHSATGPRFSEPLQRLAESFAVFVPVYPGFDGTPAHDGVKDAKDLARLVLAFADQVAEGKIDVVGHSLGGHVAAWVAVLAPDRVEQLVLEGPAGFRPPGAAPVPTDPQERAKLALVYPDRLPPDERSEAERAANREAAQGYAAGRERDEELIARLGEITALTLVLQGQKDALVADEAMQLLRGSIERSHLIYVYDAAHLIEIDQPARFFTVVNDFLTRAEAFLVNWGGGVAGVFSGQKA